MQLRSPSLSENRTEQVEARRALIDSEARFRATFENAAVGVALVGADGSILRANNSFALMFGYSIEELKARTFQDFTHPDDLATNLSVLNKTLAGEADSYSMEKRYVRKDGGIVWASLTVGCVRKADGVVDYFVSVVQDITDRKRAEAHLAERNAQLDLAGKIARIGSFIYDDGTRVVRLSPGCAAIYGLPEGALEISREDWRARVHPDDLPALDAIARRAFTKREREFVLEFRILRQGEVRWIESRVLLSYNEAGKPVRRIGAEIDVTERKRVEERLQAMNAELDHRVKNVLATATAVAAQTMNASSSLEHFVSAFDGRLRSMAQTHELLSERLWRGIPLAELLRRELAPYAGSNNAAIGGPEILLTAEAGQTLAMVFHELATNAAKHGAFSAQEGKVTVNWRRQLNGNSHSGLVIEWQETGGPPAKVEGKAGYGTSVICELIPHELAGKVDHALSPDGARCQLHIPGRWIDASATN